MATITREGAPGKDTVGQIGDICIDSTTLRKFECVAVYTTTTNNETTVEYEWDEIHSNDTGDGSGGNTEDNSAVITELLVKTGSLENQVEEIDSTLVDVQEDILELKEASDIIATDSTIIEDTHAGVFKINEIGGVHKQFTTTGAQLFDAANLTGTTGVTYSVIGDVITVEGKGAYAGVTFTMPDSPKYAGSTITLSYEKMTKTIEDAPHILQMRISDNDGNIVYKNFSSNSVKNLSYDVPSNVKNIMVQLLVNNSATSLSETNIMTFKGIMLNEGDVALPYEPYTGGIASPNPNYPQEIKKTVVTGVKTHGKNLLGCRGLVEKTINGGTFTPVYDADNNLEYVEVNGTFTANTDYYLDTMMPWYGETSRYIISGCPSGGSTTQTYGLYAYNGSGYPVDMGNGSNDFPLQKDVNYFSFIRIMKDYTANHLRFYPMIRSAEIEDDTYEPYQESTIEFSKPITLYGDPDVAVQDILTTKQVERKYDEAVFDGSEPGSDSYGWGYEITDNKKYAYLKLDEAKYPSANIMCTDYKNNGTATIGDGNIYVASSRYLVVCDKSFDNADGHIAAENWKAHLQAKPMKVVYELAEPVIEPLPEVDQAALTQLKTFEGVTYVEFISNIQPTFKAESSTTQEGSYVLDLLARTTSVEKQVEALDDTLLYAQEDILDLEEAFRIPEVTDTVLDGSYPGLLKVNEIGGKMEQFTTSGAQLFDASQVEDNKVQNHNTTNGLFNIDSNEGYWISGLIAIKPNKTYTSSVSISGAYYSDENTAITTTDIISGTTTFTAPESANFVCLNFNKASVPFGADIMLNEGDVALPYEPYTGGQASPNPSYPQEIKCVKGKNLLDCRGLEEKTENGVTFTPNYDDNGNLLYIEGNGVATADVSYRLNNEVVLNASEKYIVSDSVSTSISDYYTQLYNDDGIDLPNSVNNTTFVPRDVTYIARIFVWSGVTLDHVRFYPMIRHASVADPTYVPYGLLRVKTHGKNLFNPNNSIKKGYWSDLNTFNTSNVWHYYEVNVNKNTDYVISGRSAISTSVIIIGKDDNGNTRYNFAYTNRAFNSLESTVIGFSVQELDFTTCQLEEGPVATTYEPYTESSYTFSEPIDLYGTDDVQDVITAKEVERKYYSVTASEIQYDATNLLGYISLPNGIAKPTEWVNPYENVMCNMFAEVLSRNALIANKNISGLAIIVSSSGTASILFRIISIEQTAEAYNAFLTNTPIEVVLERATPTTEALPIADQIGLNNLLTYSDVTHVEFDCDGPQPTFKGEYGRSKETGYVLESLLNTRSNKLNQELINNKIAALEATIVSNI